MTNVKYEYIIHIMYKVNGTILKKKRVNIHLCK